MVYYFKSYSKVINSFIILFSSFILTWFIPYEYVNFDPDILYKIWFFAEWGYYEIIHTRIVENGLSEQWPRFLFDIRALSARNFLDYIFDTGQFNRRLQNHFVGKITQFSGIMLPLHIPAPSTIGNDMLYLLTSKNIGTGHMVCTNIAELVASAINWNQGGFTNVTFTSNTTGIGISTNASALPAFSLANIPWVQLGGSVKFFGG